MSLFLGCAIAWGLLSLAGCNNEETPFDNGGIPVEKGKLSFVLPLGINRATTYATVTGEPEEYQIHNLRIFWFTEDPKDNVEKLYKRFGWGEGATFSGITTPQQGEPQDPLDLTSSGNTTWASILVGDNDNFASKFFIVANVSGPDMITSDPLISVQAGVTTLDEFKLLLSDSLFVNDKDLRLLTTPLPMSISKSGAGTPDGCISVLKPAEEGTITVNLKRRVARFDIMNTADYSFFEITNVVVSRAQSRVWLLDSIFTDTDPYASRTGRFVVPATRQNDPDAFNGPRITAPSDTNVNGIDDAFESNGALFNQREHLTKAAFYLYPTVLDQSYQKTEIVLEGIYNQNTPRLYKLDLPQDVKIEANKVYTIRVTQEQPNNVRMQLLVADWEEADTLVTSIPDKVIADWGILRSTAQPAVSQAVASAGAWQFEFATSAARPDTLLFSTTGAGVRINANPAEQHVTLLSFVPKAGTVAGVDYLQSDFDAIRTATVLSSTDTKTYGAHYVTEHKIVLPPTNAPIEFVMQITNSLDSREVKTINLKSNNYGKTGLKPVVMGGLMWAPVNVGATDLPDTKGSFTNTAAGYAITGDHFQWGRNTPFASYPLALNPSASSTQFATPEAANASKVWCSNGTNWLTSNINDLWEGPGAQGPCPPGWRVPTKAEYETLMSASTRTTGTQSLNYTSFVDKSDPTKVLYFPFCGRRDTGGGSLSFYGNATGGTAIVWAATIDDGTHTGDTATPTNKPYRFAANTNQINVSEAKSNGCGVRAVRDIP